MAEDSPAEVPDRVRFGPDRIALIPVLVFFFGSLPIATSTLALGWVALLPALCAVWVVRARVVAIAAPAPPLPRVGLRGHHLRVLQP